MTGWSEIPYLFQDRLGKRRKPVLLTPSFLPFWTSNTCMWKPASPDANELVGFDHMDLDIPWAWFTAVMDPPAFPKDVWVWMEVRTSPSDSQQCEKELRAWSRTSRTRSYPQPHKLLFEDLSSLAHYKAINTQDLPPPSLCERYRNAEQEKAEDHPVHLCLNQSVRVHHPKVLSKSF